MGKQGTVIAELSMEQIELISKTAAMVAIEQLKKEQAQAQKEQHDRRLRNYRSIDIFWQVHLVFRK